MKQHVMHATEKMVSLHCHGQLMLRQSLYAEKKYCTAQKCLNQ